MRAVRKLRHWKQQFDPKAKFIWRKAVQWHGENVTIGTEIPADLANDKRKLKVFWEAKVIELFEFDDVANALTGERRSQRAKAEAVENADGPKPKTDKELEELLTKDGNSWLVQGVEDKKFRTKKEAMEVARSLDTKRIEDEKAAAVAAIEALTAIAQGEETQGEETQGEETQGEETEVEETQGEETEGEETEGQETEGKETEGEETAKDPLDM